MYVCIYIYIYIYIYVYIYIYTHIYIFIYSVPGSVAGKAYWPCVHVRVVTGRLALSGHGRACDKKTTMCSEYE